MSVSEPGPYPYLYPENPDWWNKNPPLPVFGVYVGSTSLLRQSNLSGSMLIIMQGFASNQRSLPRIIPFTLLSGTKIAAMPQKETSSASEGCPCRIDNISSGCCPSLQIPIHLIFISRVRNNSTVPPFDQRLWQHIY